jgi:hypothetical protein
MNQMKYTLNVSLKSAIRLLFTFSFMTRIDLPNRGKRGI